MQSFLRIFIVIFILALISSCKVKKNLKVENPWDNLFDGKTLNGWHVKGGKATFIAERDLIIGTSTLNTANTFLCTDKIYSDFILELEFKIDQKLNSGIQIRSESKKDYHDGVVHGYQVEIDPSDRAWSAGIYDESRRGWLNNLEGNQKASEVFKHNEWNHYRIEAIQDTIKTWINHVPAAHLIDNMTAKGFIGLQVHSIGDEEDKDGTQVFWRSLKIISKNPELYSRASHIEPIKVAH